VTILKVLLISVLFAVFGGTLPAQELSLGEVIVRSARNVEEALPQGTMVAVLNFASTSETFSDYVVEELTGELVTGRKVAIVDRRSLSLIREEMNLQLSGEVSDESAQAIGRLLGAQSIVSGNLTNMGTYYRFRVRVISVQSALIQTQISLDLRNDAQVAFLVGGSQTNAPPVASTPRQRPARPTQPAQPPATPATPREPAENRQPTQPVGKVANARNNWISAGLAAIAIGARYERMLGPRISLGANFYWSFLPITPFVGHSSGVGIGSFLIDASFRWYPWGKTFFLGLALGFGWGGNYTREDNFSEAQWKYTYGMAVTPEIGWKIDVGKAGGFYLQTGISVPLIFGNGFGGMFPRGYNFGMGYAF
jgi:TolB-like protein